MICADDPAADRVRRVAMGRRLRVLTYGFGGDDLCLGATVPTADGQRLTLSRLRPAI